MTYHDAGDVHTGAWDDDHMARHADEDRTYDPRDVADAYAEPLPLPVPRVDLTHAEWDALRVLDHGMATRTTKTVLDRERWLRGINGKCANRLVALGYARDVPHWHGVEITDSGRAVLAAMP